MSDLQLHTINRKTITKNVKNTKLCIEVKDELNILDNILEDTKHLI